MPRKSKYQENISNASLSIWKVALYIRLSREDEEDKAESQEESADTKEN